MLKFLSGRGFIGLSFIIFYLSSAFFLACSCHNPFFSIFPFPKTTITHFLIFLSFLTFSLSLLFVSLHYVTYRNFPFLSLLLFSFTLLSLSLFFASFHYLIYHHFSFLPILFFSFPLLSFFPYLFFSSTLLIPSFLFILLHSPSLPFLALPFPSLPSSYSSSLLLYQHSFSFPYFLLSLLSFLTPFFHSPAFSPCLSTFALPYHYLSPLLWPHLQSNQAKKNTPVSTPCLTFHFIPYHHFPSLPIRIVPFPSHFPFPSAYSHTNLTLTCQHTCPTLVPHLSSPEWQRRGETDLKFRLSRRTRNGR